MGCLNAQVRKFFIIGKNSYEQLSVPELSLTLFIASSKAKKWSNLFSCWSLIFKKPALLE